MSSLKSISAALPSRIRTGACRPCPRAPAAAPRPRGRSPWSPAPSQGPASITRSSWCSRCWRISAGSFSATPCAGRISVEESSGSPSACSSARTTACPGMRTPMVWRGVQQPARHLARGAQDEGVVARRVGADQSVLQVVHLGELPHFGEVTAYEREMVALVHVADASDALHRRLVADVAAERVARVRGVRDHAARADDVHRLADEPRLRVLRMHRKVLRHSLVGRADPLTGTQ